MSGYLASRGVEISKGFPRPADAGISRVSLLDIDSVYCPMGVRAVIWERLGSDYKP